MNTRIERIRRKLYRSIIERQKSVFHAGRRGILRHVLVRGLPSIVKHFDDTFEGRQSFENELLAQELFSKYDWLVPATKHGARKLIMRRYGDQHRLDRCIPAMDDRTRSDVAQQVLLIAWDMFYEGYAHRDLHAKNLFWLDGSLRLGDFETLLRYPPAEQPPFPSSYDVTGQGLPSPYRTDNMGYAAERDDALGRQLGIPTAAALEGVRNRLKDELCEASLSFQAKNRRHNCRAGRIYNAFSLPCFSVPLEEGQRDAAKRLQSFKATADEVAGRRILDLGSNIGGMLFEVQKLCPAACLGVEYDQAKIKAAQKVVRYAGLKNVRFLRADIDHLEPASVGGTYDAVFCLSINLHVGDPKRLFWLLGQVTKGRLYFEGNAGTNLENVTHALAANGFKAIEHLGVCNDDWLPENNVRPLLTAQHD